MKNVNDEIIKTKSIQTELNEFSKAHDVDVSACDFIIHHTDTYIKDSSDNEFKIINIDINQEYKDKSKLLNEHVELQQRYHIEIILQASKKIELIYKIERDPYSSNPKMTISPKSTIPHKTCKPQELFNLLYIELTKIKAQNNILINIFDENMVKNLKALTKYIYAGKFVKKVRIPLFEGIEPLIKRESKLLLHFKEKETNNQVKEVDEGELLVEYIKPIFGSHGFNSKGEIISSGFANNDDDLLANIDKDSIDILEDKHKKQYRSKIRGFVHYNGVDLRVDNKVKLSKLSRNQDSLAQEEENNIEVTISQNDTNKDSVGEGVELTSETIHITGHVGAHSIIESINLQIDGATHQESSQFAKYAKINRHKGTLRCHNAKISLLEGGEVNATHVDIDTALGGTIYAQDVVIDHVKSNLKVYASNSITIRLISGEDNQLKINYKDIPILNSKIELIQDDITDLKYDLDEARRHNKSQVQIIKKQIQEYKDEQLSIRNSTQNAKITIKKPLIGLNVLIFTINEENEIIFKTDATSYNPFYIEIAENKVTLFPVNKSINLQ